MKSGNTKHLTQHQITMAVVDSADLSQAELEHLEACPLCLRDKKQLDESLNSLGHAANQMAPSLKKRIILPTGKEPDSKISWFFNWRGAFAMAVTVIFVMVVWWKTPIYPPVPIDKEKLSREIMQANRRLMAEVDQLVENALPQSFIDLSGGIDTEDENDFMRFLIPSVENDHFSFEIEKKGMRKWRVS
jgi:hypothetical protein